MFGHKDANCELITNVVYNNFQDILSLGAIQ